MWQDIGPDDARGVVFRSEKIGEWHATVWEVGGEIAWRSRLRNGLTDLRVASHYSRETAKASAEKRLRKAAT